jgi:arginyl-tRNA synthetase
MVLSDIKKMIAKKIAIDENKLIYPPDTNWGDFCLPIFELAKEKKIAPQIIADELKNKINKDKKLTNILSKTEIVGAYLNFFIKPEYLADKVLNDIRKQKKKYGSNNNGKNKVVVFEFSNVNTHKNFHIGHLRNVCFGESMTNIFKTNGYKSYPVSYINDFGIHVAKAIWSYKKGYSQDLNKCYAHTVKEMEKNSEIIKEVGVIMSDIEKHQGENYVLWKKTRKMSLQAIGDIYKKNNIKFKKTYYESQVITNGFKIVKKLIDKNVLVSSQGAIIADLEKYGLSVLPIIRSDGTALYPVADLALAEIKSQDFKNLSNSYVVVDIRQSLYFKQLSKILELANYKQKLSHLPYEFVTLPEGMMSSRSGNAVPYIDLYHEIFKCLKKETKKRHSEWFDKKIEKNCSELAIAILKFEMLKISPQKIITFNINEAIKFDGFSALYILYGLVRIKSIIKKAKFKNVGKFKFNLLNNKKEKELILYLAKYPEIIIRSEKKQDQSEIAKYLLELLKLFNDYYQQVRILQSEADVKKSRLTLLSSTLIVVENALDILGIKPLNEI